MIEHKEINIPFPWDNDKSIKGNVYIIPPSPDNGYNCGYSIFIPEGCQVDTTLLVHCCNTGKNVPIHLDEANKIAKDSAIDINPGMWYASDLKMPLLIPLFPRVQGYYTQALGSKVFNNDISTLVEDQLRREDKDKLSSEEIIKIQEQCRNMPEQLVNIIKSSKIVFNQLGIHIDDKVIIEGYSAGSKFANGFTALHPEMVKACICGGNSGLGIIPLSEIQGQKLNFPIGVADIENFDYEAFMRIPQLYYIGTEDYNDPAMYKCDFKTDANGKYLLDNERRKIPVTDSSGSIIPILDENNRFQPRNNENYTQTEIEQIHNFMGSNPQTRFNNNERIYNELGINAKFKRFTGTHETVTKKHDENYNFSVNECIEQFINDVVQDRYVEYEGPMTNIEINGQTPENKSLEKPLVRKLTPPTSDDGSNTSKNQNSSSNNSGFVNIFIALISSIIIITLGILTACFFK